MAFDATPSAHTASSLLARVLSTRARRAMLGAAVIVCLLGALVYHLVLWQQGTPAPAWVRILYGFTLLLGYGGLWVLLEHRLRQRRTNPNQIIWATFVSVLVLFLLSRAVMSVGGSQAGFDLTTQVPLTWVSAVKASVLSVIEALLAFALMLQLRDLVLFKRTRTSLRNWLLMLGGMALAAGLTLGKTPSTALTPWQTLAIVPVVGLMTVNAFRLSWIVFLSFREKLACMGLAVLLGTLLTITLVLQISSDTYDYVTHYSFPLHLFVVLATAFGILYCTTALLSLLFHLPTTGDFQQKAGEIAAMHSLSALVTQVFDAEKLASTIAASPVQAGSARAAWLAVRDPESGSLKPKLAATFGLSRERVHELVDLAALYDEVASRREPLLLEEATTDPRVRARPGELLGSLLALPLMARDEVLGALFVTKEVSHGFEEDDVEATAVFAAQAALVLDNARLFEQQIEKERLQHELGIARDVQQRLLPQRLPTVEGLSLHASSVMAHEVGGDYYDVVELPDGRLAFIVADVSGKGTSAAFYMANLQGAFRALAPQAPSPTAFLAAANGALAEAMERHVFITVTYGVLDPHEETLTLARAGHCPAAHIDLHGQARLLKTPGMGLGLNHTGLFEKMLQQETVHLRPGDAVVLYTDGVVESMSADEEEYGYDRLLDALREHRHEEAPALHDALLGDLHGFLGHARYDDDLTLVVLKWHGVPTAAVRADGEPAEAPARETAAAAQPATFPPSAP